MNCKPNDLAIVIRDIEGHHIGKIISIIGPGELPNAWLTCPELIDPDGTLCEAVDADCRPIRDQDGEDESLTWAGKPANIKTPEHTK